VFARGGDTALQKKLGFTYSIDFETGIKRALDYYASQTETPSKRRMAQIVTIRPGASRGAEKGEVSAIRSAK
jgi:hypothetical protein